MGDRKSKKEQAMMKQAHRAAGSGSMVVAVDILAAVLFLVLVLVLVEELVGASEPRRYGKVNQDTGGGGEGGGREGKGGGVGKSGSEKPNDGRWTIFRRTINEPSTVDHIELGPRSQQGSLAKAHGLKQSKLHSSTVRSTTCT